MTLCVLSHFIELKLISHEKYQWHMSKTIVFKSLRERKRPDPATVAAGKKNCQSWLMW